LSFLLFNPRIKTISFTVFAIIGHGIITLTKANLAYLFKSNEVAAIIAENFNAMFVFAA
jgi:hypothetical protein